MRFKIREEMDRQGVTLRGLSEKTGLSVRTLEEFIKRNSGNIKIYAKIIQALNVSFNALVELDFDEDESFASTDERAVSDISVVDMYNIYDNASRCLSSENESLSGALILRRDALKLQAALKEAEDFEATGEYKYMMEKYTNIFLTMKASDVCNVPLTAISKFVDLCKEYSAQDNIDAFIDKITSKRFSSVGHKNDIQKLCAVLIESLSSHGMVQQVEQMMEIAE